MTARIKINEATMKRLAKGEEVTFEVREPVTKFLVSMDKAPESLFGRVFSDHDSLFAKIFGPNS